MQENLFLQNVSEEKTFKLAKTTIELRNLLELAEALEIMSDNSFKHHVMPTRNDFVNWVKESVNDNELAKRLQGVTDRKQAHRIVTQRINQLQAPVKKQSHGKEFVIGIVAGLLVGVLIGVLLLKNFV